jgi:sugar/nucleoside kinase (ribokinase family)
MGRNSDKVREVSFSDASSSRGNKLRDPVSLSLEIRAMIDRHEPDKDKQAKILTQHLARHRTMSSTEEELQQHLERKAKRETERQLATSKAEAH